MSEGYLQYDFSTLKVSHEAALEYERKGEKLLERLNQLMTEREDIGDLLGMTPQYVMLDNNSNHLRFITNVLKLNDYELPAKTLPWVYKTYLSRGFSPHFFPEVLKGWMEAILEILYPETAQEILSVYRAMLEFHEFTLSRSEGALIQMEVDEEWRPVEKKAVFSLLKGDYKELLDIAREVIKDENTLKEFYIKVVQPAMYEIGILWQTGEISVAEEHLATSMMNRLMASTYDMITTIAAHPRRKAVVLSSQNEYHELGARIVADFLELKGWNVSFLGVNTPVSEVLKLLEKTTPFLLAVSVTMSFNLDSAKKLIQSIKSSRNLSGMRIMVGGLVFNESQDLWQRIGADGTANNALEAVHLAEKWWNERG